jgi:hypothetical protein
MRISPAIALALLAACLSADAAGPQVWNSSEFTFYETGWFRADLLGVVRSRNHLTDAFDDRLGAQIVFPVRPRLSIGGGYMKRWVDPDGRGAHAEDRVFLAPRLLLAYHPIKIESLTSWERNFSVPGLPDFNRYRETIDVEKVRHGASPFFFEQVSFRDYGLAWTRTAVGLRWRLHSGFRFEAGYQFESQKIAGAWVPRHAIRTAIGFRKPRPN